MATLKTKIQLRRDTAENLKDVKLEVGEPGYATDTKKFVIGDNSTKFSDLKGRVMGPNASTDNALAKFDGTSGQVIQNSNATLSDAGQLKVVNWKDERYASNVAMSRWTTTAKEIIIYTKIKFVSSAVMPIVRLHGYAYGQNAPIELKIGFYIYNSAYTNMGAVSMGAWRPEIRLFKYTASDSVDYVAIGFIGTCYYGGFQVDVQAAALGTLDSNILTTGWSVSTFTTEGNVPAVGTDKSKNVPYKSTLANLTINGTTYNGSSNVTFNLAEADHNHDDDYLKEEIDTLQTVTDRGATTTKAIITAGLTTTSGYVNITGTSGFSEGVRLHSVGNLSSVWWNATADKDYCTNGMWGITAYDYGYSDSAKKNTFRFRGPTSQTATSPTDQMWIDSTGLVTSRGGFAKSGSSDSYILLAGGGTKAVSDFSTTDTKVTQSNTTTANWRKVILSAQSDATAGTAVTEQTNKVYETPNVEVQPSTGSLRAAGTVQMNQLKITSTNMINHIEFARNSWNYIVASGGTSAAFGFVAGGKSASGANSTFAVLGDRVIPGQTDNKIDLGSSDYHFQDFYIKGKIYNGSYNYTLPAKTGTIALTSDIPDVSDFLTSESDTLQTVTNRGNITTNIIKIQNGAASGAFVLGADVNATTLTANQRKLGRMGVPSYDSTTKTVAGISFDSQATVNYADFGGHPNNTASIAPDVIRFTVANSHDNTVNGARTLALQISKQNGLVDSAGGGTSVAAAKFFIPVQTTSSITSDEGFIHGGLTAATGKTRNDYVLLAGGSTKPISDFAMDSEIPDVSDFVTKSTAQTITGNKTFTGNVVTSNNKFEIKANSNTDDSWIKLTNKSDTGYYAFGIRRPYDSYGLQLKIHGTDGTDTYYDIWHAGNDGSGSGLDADKLDGQEGSYYLNYNNLTNKPTIPTVNNGKLTIQRNGTTVATFTANQEGDTTANITDNDTLNTAGSTNDEAKLYLVGTKSQVESAQTYSDAEVYTEAGEFNATSICVAEHGQIKYDSATQCIRFVIN